MSTDNRYVGAIDQGTTSTRFMIFDHRGLSVGSAQKEHRQIYPEPGWVEHDPGEIWTTTQLVIAEALEQSGVRSEEIAAIGITNQRETAVLWDRVTGEALGNAIVWQDTRTAALVEELAETDGIDRFRGITGLPLATYFTGPKFRWILDHDDDIRKVIVSGRVAAGTIDSWVLWNLTGGPRGGVHATDVTNASRTLLMNLETCDWDQSLLDEIGVPLSVLPAIHPSIPAQPYGYTVADGPLGKGVPVAGILGDQQAALFGQACFERGSLKNTYGTGCFVLLNTGAEIVRSSHGLITTPAYQREGEEPRYALEGSIAVAGALVQWLRDNLGLIKSSEEIETLASQVEDNGGVYFVPAFSGLFAPHWRPDARGTIAGLTAYATSGHLARAVLEATAFQTLEVMVAMEQDAGVKVGDLKVDGGMVANQMLMQFQSDLLGVPVIRPKTTETTALGAAYAAGLSCGYWQSLEELTSQWTEDRRWNPVMESSQRAILLGKWKKAVQRSFGWEDAG